MFRILLAEDYPPFRRFIRAELRSRAEFQIVAEVSDGLEAVQQARTLQPDLILLDIGLPTLNGVEAARQIRQILPNARLLFISQDSSSEVVRETLRLGALGYVHKLRAQSDLIPAIEAVLGGRQFVSSGLDFGEKPERRARHEVQFYSDDTVFVETIGHFIASALMVGNPAIVLATKDHRRALAQRLRKQGFDVDSAIRDQIYIGRDAAGTLSQVMVNDHPDLGRFLAGLKGLIASTAGAGKAGRVAIFGECVGLLCARGHTTAAIELEQAGNGLLETEAVDIMCAYPLGSFPSGEDDAVFRRISAEHTAVCSR